MKVSGFKVVRYSVLNGFWLYILEVTGVKFGNFKDCYGLKLLYYFFQKLASCKKKDKVKKNIIMLTDYFSCHKLNNKPKPFHEKKKSKQLFKCQTVNVMNVLVIRISMFIEFKTKQSNIL